MAEARQRSKQDDDEVKGKGYDLKLFRRLLTYAKPYRVLLIIAMGCNLGVSALSPLRPWLTKVAIDEHITTGDYHGLLKIIMLLLTVLLGSGLVLYGLTYLMQYIGQHIIHDLRLKLFAHLSKMDLKYYDRTPVGRIVTRVTNDIDALNDMFSSGIVMIACDILVVLWIVIFMFIMNWRLALITLGILPILVVATFLFRAKVRQAFRDTRKHLSGLNTFMQEHLSGMQVVQLFGREKRELARFGTINADYKAANIRTIYYYALYFPVVELLSAIALAMIIWYGGGSAVQNSGVTMGEIVAFIQFTDMFFRPIFDLSDKYNVLQGAFAAAERIFQLSDEQPAIREPVEPAALARARGDISFQQVRFGYDPENVVLKDLSFDIKAGETVAIVGHTGAGKSTIINLLCRFYDVQAGKITLDGQDIRQYRQQDLRRQVAIVLQDVFLFPGSIRDNITLGNAEISEERVHEAAKLTGADKFIAQLPQGYETILSEGGGNLSVGQRQLLAFARAMAYQPPILVLDEATASVDTETERLIQSAITRLLAERTAIVIAHRLSTIQNADKILVLHHGELREAGTHQQLLAQRGIYYRLYQLQYQEQESARPAATGLPAPA